LNWWRKLGALRRGGSKADLKYFEGDLAKYLRQALERFAKRRQRWERWLCRELGADVREGMGCVRVAVESRLGTLQSTFERGTPGYGSAPERTQNHM
jgi:hypothetical protein